MLQNLLHILDHARKVRREALVAPLYNLLYLGLTCPNKAVFLPKPLKKTLKTQGMGILSHQ
jgi:hypothetical protein